jgi:hypothetical protein
MKNTQGKHTKKTSGIKNAQLFRWGKFLAIDTPNAVGECDLLAQTSSVCTFVQLM